MSIHLKQIDQNLFGLFDESDDQLLIIEASGPECHVREFSVSQPRGRGRLLCSFYGADALEEARQWALRHLQKVPLAGAYY